MEEALFDAARAGDTEYLIRNQDPGILPKLNLQGDTACRVALRENRLEFVFQMGCYHPPILCQPNADGDTVLHCLLRMGQLQLFSDCLIQLRIYFDEYIEKDFCPDGANYFPVDVLNCVHALRNAEGKPLVYMAAENGYDEAVRTLMKLPLLRRTDGPNGSTALHVAVRKRYHGIAQVLLEHKSDIVLCQDGDGNTALHLAVMQNDPRMVEILVKESCGWQPVKILNNGGHSPFHLAATMKYLEIYKCSMSLLTSIWLQPCLFSLIPEADVSSTPLHDAVRERNYDIAQVLLEHIPDIVLRQDVDGNTAFHHAVIQNDHRMVELLVKGSCGQQLVKILNNDGHSSFHLAATMNYLKIFQLLLQLCPACYLANTTCNQNVLHLAVQEKATKIVEFIVKDKKMAEYMINQQDNNGNTPLHTAASNGQKRTLNILFASQVPVQALKNKEGLTFLDISKRKIPRLMEHMLRMSRYRVSLA